MKLLMLTRGPFIESPTPPCTTRMTHFISTRGRRVRGTSDNQNIRVDVCVVLLCLSALLTEFSFGFGLQINRSCSSLKNTAVLSELLSSLPALRLQKRVFCLCVRKILIYIPGNICFPLGRGRCGCRCTKRVRGPIISIFH